MKFIRSILLALIVVAALALAWIPFRGQPLPGGYGLLYQAGADRKDSFPTSPFESTTNSRYALVEAMAENKTFFFTDTQAEFSAPDMVFYQSRFFSIFPPGISFLALPLYILGRSVQYPQFVSFQLNYLFLPLILYLIIRLSQRLGATASAGLVGGLVFIFTTSALAYTPTLTQHLASTFLILLAVLNSLSSTRTLLTNLAFGFILGLGVLIDIPNLFFFLPSLVYVLYRHLSFTPPKIKINLSLAGVALAVIPSILLFGWYNHRLTGSYFLLGQTVGRSDYPPKPKHQDDQPSNSFNYRRRDISLDTRFQLHGFYQLLVSPERGWFYYSPIVALGILGLYLASKSTTSRIPAILCLSTIAITIVLYSMHGDPWGGWAFGPRYLIPPSALAGSGLALAIVRYKRRLLFISLFVILTAYGVLVSTSGALTTLLVPPKVEAIHFPKPVPYTYRLNLEYIFSQRTGSLVYNLWLKRFISVPAFYLTFSGLAFALISISYILARHDR